MERLIIVSYPHARPQEPAHNIKEIQMKQYIQTKLTEPTSYAGVLLSLSSLIPVTPATWHPYIYAIQTALGIALFFYTEHKKGNI